jgi:serine/threonine protein kinase
MIFILSKFIDIKKKYNLMKILGYGSFGMVRLGEDIHNSNLKYAIKTV